MEFGFPVGVRFHPTDQELVGHYLHNRVVMGDQFQTKSVSDCPDFYGQNEPWVIWDLYGGNKSRNVEALYFFTHRNKLNTTAECFDQKVGSGTWREQHSEDVVAKDDSVMGISRHFQYEGGSDSHQNGAWLMQEYQIMTTHHNNDATDQELVLCTLRKNLEKLPLPTTTAAAENGNDAEDCCSRSST
ncbi:NAC domain-containing protein 101-like [Rosa sericea]